MIFLVFFGFIICYWSTLLSFTRTYYTIDMYSHGFLVPLISLLMLMGRRERIRNTVANPGYLPGAVILFTGLFGLLIGKVGGIKVAEDISFIITISGLVILIGGTRVFRISIVPIAYLIFMIPIWEYLTNPIHYPFRLITAKISTVILSLVGIPVYRTNSLLYLPNITLEVAKECSGVNYLISLVTIGIPLSFLFLRSNIRRAILITLSIFIALMSNSIRVSMIGIYSYINEGALNYNVHGPFDMFRALFVAAVGLIILLVGLYFLSDMKNQDSIESKISWEKFKDLMADIYRLKPDRFASWISILMLLICVVYMNTITIYPVPLNRELHSFPYRIGDWVGHDKVSKFDVYRYTGVTQELARSYQGPKGEKIDIYIGYFDFQEQGKEIVNYKMRKYFKNGNKILVRKDNQSYYFNNVVLDEGYNKISLVYLFIINGRVVNNIYLAKIYNVLDGILYHRTNGSVVIVFSTSYGDKDIREEADTLKRFLSDVLPLTTQYLALS